MCVIMLFYLVFKMRAGITKVQHLGPLWLLQALIYRTAPIDAPVAAGFTRFSQMTAHLTTVI